MNTSTTIADIESIPLPGSPRCRFRCDRCDKTHQTECRQSALNILMTKAWRKDWCAVLDFITHLPALTPTTTTEFINTCDLNHEYFITVACKQRNADIAQRLLDLKCDISVCDAYGRTPTRIAVENNDIRLLTVLSG